MWGGGGGWIWVDGESGIPFSAISLAPFEVDFRAHQYVSKVEGRERKGERAEISIHLKNGDCYLSACFWLSCSSGEDFTIQNSQLCVMGNEKSTSLNLYLSFCLPIFLLPLCGYLFSLQIHTLLSHKYEL